MVVKHMIRVGILTASDKGSKGERIDESGKTIEDLVSKINGHVLAYKIVPDERTEISKALIEMSDVLNLDLILTTGGTGFSSRDVTPEATLDVIQKIVPGIPEYMRYISFSKTPRSILSRSVSGIRGKTLIINLPGSPKGVKECLESILAVLPHAVEILRGEASECAQNNIT